MKGMLEWDSNILRDEEHGMYISLRYTGTDIEGPTYYNLPLKTVDFLFSYDFVTYANQRVTAMNRSMPLVDARTITDVVLQAENIVHNTNSARIVQALGYRRTRMGYALTEEVISKK